MSNVAQSVSGSGFQSQSTSSANTTQPLRNPFADPNGPFANLDLTSQQQTQIAQILSQAQSSGNEPRSQINSQIDAVLTTQQQATLKSDIQTLHADHHHQDGGSSGASNPLAQLDLTSSQQTEIGQIIQSAQSSGSSSSDVLNQIDGVLNPTQQQQLVSLFASDTSTQSGPAAQSTQAYVINTKA